MAPVNPKYSKKISGLKELLVRNISANSTPVTFSTFATKLVKLWESILCENFVFSFKNSEEIKAYSILDDSFSRLLWNLKNEILKCQQKLSNEILSCQNIDIKSANARLKLEIERTLADKSQSAQANLKQYFKDSPYKEILAHWQTKYLRYIEDFFEDENRRINQALDEYTTLRNMQITNNEAIQSSWGGMIEAAKQKAIELKRENKRLSENELNQQFDEIWNVWISKLDSFPRKTDSVQDILAAFSEDLYRMFNAHKDLLNVHLNKSPLSNLENCSFKTFPSLILEDLDCRDRKLTRIIKDTFTYMTKPNFKKRCLNSAQDECSKIFSEIKKM